MADDEHPPVIDKTGPQQVDVDRGADPAPDPAAEPEEDGAYSHWLNLKGAQLAEPAPRVRVRTMEDAKPPEEPAPPEPEPTDDIDGTETTEETQMERESVDLPQQNEFDKISGALENLAMTVDRSVVDTVSRRDLEQLSTSINSLTNAFLGLRAELAKKPGRTELWIATALVAGLVIAAIAVESDAVAQFIQFLKNRFMPAG